MGNGDTVSAGDTDRHQEERPVRSGSAAAPTSCRTTTGSPSPRSTPTGPWTPSWIGRGAPGSAARRVHHRRASSASGTRTPSPACQGMTVGAPPANTDPAGTAPRTPCSPTGMTRNEVYPAMTRAVTANHGYLDTGSGSGRRGRRSAPGDHPGSRRSADHQRDLRRDDRPGRRRTGPRPPNSGKPTIRRCCSGRPPTPTPTPSSSAPKPSSGPTRSAAIDTAAEHAVPGITHRGGVGNAARSPRGARRRRPGPGRPARRGRRRPGTGHRQGRGRGARLPARPVREPLPTARAVAVAAGRPGPARRARRVGAVPDRPRRPRPDPRHPGARGGDGMDIRDRAGVGRPVPADTGPGR